jgi:hypothetical protein
MHCGTDLIQQSFAAVLLLPVLRCDCLLFRFIHARICLKTLSNHETHQDVFAQLHARSNEARTVHL